MKNRHATLLAASIVLSCVASVDTFDVAAQPGGSSPMYTTPPEPFPPTRDALKASLSKVSGLSKDTVEHLTAQALPAILLVSNPTDDQSIPIGASKLGGAPDLPADLPWPDRPPYPDAESRIGFYRLMIGPILAKAGIAPDWLAADEGQRYVAQQQEAERSAIASTLESMPPETVAQMRPIFESQMHLTRESALEQSQPLLLKSKMVDKAMPLSFIAQIDLSSLSSEPGFGHDLPDHGRLLLFYDRIEEPSGYDPGSATGFRLIWDQTPVDRLVRAPIPTALSAFNEPSAILKPAAIRPHSVVTPITPFERAWDAIPQAAATSETFGEGPFWAYQQWTWRFGDPTVEGRANHQLGGWAQPLQNGLQARAQLAANGIAADDGDNYETPEAKQVLMGASDWKLVLQIGVDSPVGLTAGAYYVLMRSDDLRNRRFDKAWVIYQGS